MGRSMPKSANDAALPNHYRCGHGFSSRTGTNGAIQCEWRHNARQSCGHSGNRRRNPSIQSEITVPNVRGETGAQASQAFFALGVQVVSAANVTQPGVKAGTVLEQVPAAGSKVALNDTTIHLTIAASGPSSVRFVPHRRG